MKEVDLYDLNKVLVMRVLAPTEPQWDVAHPILRWEGRIFIDVACTGHFHEVIVRDAVAMTGGAGWQPRASNTTWKPAEHEGECMGTPSETRHWCNHPAHWQPIESDDKRMRPDIAADLEREREVAVKELAGAAEAQLRPDQIKTHCGVAETLHGTAYGEHDATLPSGMQKDYVVLTAEERAKGFVEPVRRTYFHEKCKTTTTMGRELAETYARCPDFYSGTFCCTCGAHFPVGEKGEFVWDDGTNQKVGTRRAAKEAGC